MPNEWCACEQSEALFWRLDITYNADCWFWEGGGAAAFLCLCFSLIYAESYLTSTRVSSISLATPWQWALGSKHINSLRLLDVASTWPPIHRQLRARRALLQCKDVLLRSRRALLLYKVYGNSALLVLNRTSLKCNNALLALNWRHSRASVHGPHRTVEREPLPWQRARSAHVTYWLLWRILLAMS